jgi:hypothetical protein
MPEQRSRLRRIAHRTFAFLAQGRKKAPGSLLLPGEGARHTVQLSDESLVNMSYDNNAQAALFGWDLRYPAKLRDCHAAYGDAGSGAAEKDIKDIKHPRWDISSGMWNWNC